jgi:hypothetical protein
MMARYEGVPFTLGFLRTGISLAESPAYPILLLLPRLDALRGVVMSCTTGSERKAL